MALYGENTVIYFVLCCILFTNTVFFAEKDKVVKMIIPDINDIKMESSIALVKLTMVATSLLIYLGRETLQHLIL